MKLAATTLRGAKKVKDSQNKVPSLSSALNPGGHYRLFLRKIKNDAGEYDIASATGYTRKLDRDVFGVSSALINDTVERNGICYDNTVLYHWERIVRIIHQAECAQEKAAAVEEAKKIAEQTGRQIDTFALNQKQREIELSYNGDPKAKPQPIYPDKRAIMSSMGATSMTEMLLVPLKDDGSPNFNDYRVVGLELNNKKQNAILALLDNADYCREDDDFLEIGYDYIGVDKKQAGQNATFQGISKELSLKTKYPEVWEKNKDKLEEVMVDPETIAARSFALSSDMSVESIVESIKSYMSKHPLTLTYMDFESEAVKKNAKTMLDFGIAEDLPTVKDQLIAIVEASNPADDDQAVEEGGLDAEKAANAVASQTIKELAESVDDLDSLVNGTDIDEL